MFKKKKRRTLRGTNPFESGAEREYPFGMNRHHTKPHSKNTVKRRSLDGKDRDHTTNPMTPGGAPCSKRGYGGPRKKWSPRCNYCENTGLVRGLSGYQLCPHCSVSTGSEWED
jgi:hypothetical protein